MTLNNLNCLVLFSLFVQLNAYRSEYIAAVVDFGGSSEPQPDCLWTNLKGHVHFIQEAKYQGADIVVFPENGLQGLNNPFEEVTLLLPYPTYHIIPCGAGIYSQVLQELSCAAKNNSIYVVVNVPEREYCYRSEDCPHSGYRIYNTNIVFARNGAVIAKHRKFHLFAEPMMVSPESPDITIFTTDFGVVFGMFTCAELLFERPSHDLVYRLGIKNIIFSSDWYRELPFTTAVQMQSWWSYAMKVNLLASTFNDPSWCLSGSGIHLGRHGIANSTTNFRAGSTLITARVPIEPHTLMHQTGKWGSIAQKNERDFTPRSFIVGEDSVPAWIEDIRFHSMTVLNDIEVERTICNNDICCAFNISLVHNGYDNPDYYSLNVYHGPRSYFGYVTGGVQICAVLACRNESAESCGHYFRPTHAFKQLDIQGNFSSVRNMLAPTTLRYEPKLSPLPATYFQFLNNCGKELCNASLSLMKTSDSLLTFGILGRHFLIDFTK